MVAYVFCLVSIYIVSARGLHLQQTASSRLTQTDLASPYKQGVSPSIIKSGTAQIPPPREWGNMKVLIYWCAKFADRNVDLLIRNVEHLKEARLQFDLLVGHYDENKQSWIDRNETWYREHVRWGIDKPGFKVHLLKTIWDQKLAGVEFDLANYDWVWMLDEDVDITNSLPYTLFRSAKLTMALIVGPAFLQKDPLVTTAFMAPYYPMNTPRLDMLYRYVPLVEIIMPLFRPQALIAFFECGTCLPPYNSDWGLDHIWCANLATKFQASDRKTCAIVDHAGPIVHLNYRSTREEKSAASIQTQGKLSVQWLKKNHPYYYRNDHFHKWASWDGYLEIPYDVESDRDWNSDVLPAEPASDSAPSAEPANGIGQPASDSAPSMDESSSSGNL